MSYLSKLSLLIFGCMFSLITQAVIISGKHVTPGGKIVNLQGLEWLSLEHTANLSTNEIKDGFTDNYGITYSGEEFRYATRSETELLLGSLWGGNYSGWSADNADGAKWFLDHFWGLQFDTGSGKNRINLALNDTSGRNQYTGRDGVNFFFGAENECALKLSCGGQVLYFDLVQFEQSGINVVTGETETTNAPGDSIGRFLEENGVDMGLNDNNYDIATYIKYYDWGHLLVKASTSNSVPSHYVSTPATLSIILFALLVSFISKRNSSLIC